MGPLRELGEQEQPTSLVGQEALGSGLDAAEGGFPCVAGSLPTVSLP